MTALLVLSLIGLIGGFTALYLIFSQAARRTRSVDLPAPGEKWEHLYPPEPRYDGSPWPIPDKPGEVVTVTIRDTQNGWVRFYHGDKPDDSGDGPRDRREHISNFMRRFTRKPPETL
jgi:hypothetical protein